MLTRRTPMKRRGKRVDQWDRIRAKLKIQFERAFITRCEMCGSSYALGFCHRFPRRMCDENELHIVALVCNDPCHKIIDGSGHANMKNMVEGLIAKRVGLL